MALGRLAHLPSDLLERDPERLAADLTVLRAARKFLAKEAAADMEQVGEGDSFGVGRVLAMLYRQTVTG